MSFESRQKQKQNFYKCSECGFTYKEKEWAEKCQKWCKKYKTCNLEIIKHSVKVNNKSKQQSYET